MTSAARLSIVALIVNSLSLLAAEPPPRPTERGKQLIDKYIRAKTKEVADACLADVKSKEDWEKKRPELRRQFLDMMGLWPLPPRTDLKATITGKIESDDFTIEKLHFQSIPGLYVSANLYVPKKAKLPAPAILYVCGHGSTIINGVSYGNKAVYQYHPAWFASHGYVCLIVDTLQLGEIQGIHHGTHPGHKLGHWWWHTLGYTPAGIECWNAMRALDYLETRKEVDPKRIGVTGRSGGGATSWWLAAADERPQCIIPVAGIVDLWAHNVEGKAERLRKGVIAGHCDCMYMTNTYQWDFPLVAALCAPRPTLLGNSDVDDIFPVEGYRRLADKVRPIYKLYDAEEKFQLMETKGPHKDTPELRKGAFEWMNRWLMNDTAEVKLDEQPKFMPQELQVFKDKPQGAINATVHELFIKPARIELPKSPEVAKEWWRGRAPQLTRELQEKVFRGWTQSAPDLKVQPAGEVKKDGLRLRGFDFTSETGVELRLWLLTAEKTEKPKLVVLNVLDDAGWREWLNILGPDFKDLLQGEGDVTRDDKQFTSNQRVLEKFGWAYAFVVPRGCGPTRWAMEDSPEAAQIKRRFVLLGQTLDGQRVWDVRRGLAVLRSLDGLKDVPAWLQGKGQQAGIALYASLFEPDVVRLDLWNPPASHRQGPYLLNVRRVLDMPQALALGLPYQIRLYVADETEAKQWDWPVQLQKALGQESLKIRVVKAE
ncbi:MAG: alpha/beta hydrolase family protein [Gemmataceae bacterium]